jgi:hypothetical protein
VLLEDAGEEAATELAGSARSIRRRAGPLLIRHIRGSATHSALEIVVLICSFFSSMHVARPAA